MKINLIQFIRKKKAQIMLFLITNLFLFFALILMGKILDIPIEYLIIIIGLQFVSSMIFFMIRINHTFNDFTEHILEPITALSEALGEFRTNKSFIKSVNTDIRVSEIHSIMDNFSILAKEISLYYNDINTKSATESVLNRYNADLMTVSSVDQLYSKIKDVIVRMLNPEYGAVLSIENGEFIERAEWNIHSLNRQKNPHYSQLSLCPALRNTIHVSQNEVYGNDGCKHCSPVNENRQSSICYTFAEGGNPYLILHIGSRKQERFDSFSKHIIDRVASITNLRMKQIFSNQEIEEKAYTDKLTGLKNKHYIIENIEKFIASRIPFSIILFDVDFFKKVNDTYGHPVGDFVLQEISKILMRCVSGDSFVGRYGGEELLIVTPNLFTVNAVVIAEEARIMIQDHLFKYASDKEPLRITTSVGVSNFPNDGLTYEDVFKKSDDALYRAKQTGKNKVICWVNNL